MLAVSTIEAKFRRSKINSKNTFLWSQLSDHKKEIIISYVLFSEGEQCWIMYEKSKDYFWIITNQRIIIFCDGTIRYYSYQMVSSVQFPLIDEKNDKRNVDNLNLVLNDCSCLIVFVESTTWHFIYGLLRLLIFNWHNK